MMKLAQRLKAACRKWGFTPTILAQPPITDFGSLTTFVEPDIPADADERKFRFYLVFNPVDPERIQETTSYAAEVPGLARRLGYDPATDTFRDVDMYDYFSVLQISKRQPDGSLAATNVAEVLNAPGVAAAVNAELAKAFR